MRLIVCIAVCLATVACSASTQRKSARTVAAFEVPLPSEADREQFLGILRTAAAAEGMHVDVESKQDLENAARASPLLAMTNFPEYGLFPRVDVGTHRLGSGRVP
jgi:hypothetical protein